MIKISKYTLRLLFPIIGLFFVLFVSNVIDSHAKETNNKQHHSKDFITFLFGTPEAVLTAFVEADLGATDNRDNDERISLWWKLTELKGASDDCQRLLIKSYKIGRKTTDERTGDIYLLLEMDVRAIVLYGQPSDHNNFCRWRDINVYLDTNNYLLSKTKYFTEEVFGKGKIERDLFLKKPGHYLVPKDKRKWSFPVRMVNKKGKWLIATESIPLITTYVFDDLREQKTDALETNAMQEVCENKRTIDKIVMKTLHLYKDDKKIGTDLKKYKFKYCTSESIALRKEYLQSLSTTIQLLESAEKE